ncbi:uncharacterized protein A1O9_05755 [Exophiala aquamarina CBS 119918]|uniref:Regulator of phospholipase D SRF1 n=1 Tax=Exophiala aquamarina CBS 119918 TaxID=1182545 RepID=A0A072PQR6_9EURO|nr:uncharacterized protein A1O9_05755 [Exophiala aquamarina CBS 119918]KEF57835.1 hypothetical protein A1O9_05755 [Exophiala aquamarina CBS 119918]
MAQNGFPWLSQSRDPEKDPSLLDPNQAISRSGEPAPNPRATSPNSSAHPKRQSGAPHSNKRTGSGKTPPPVKSSIPNGLSDPQISKATSPLPVRTIPPWVQDAEEDDLDDTEFSLPGSPGAAFVAQHNHSPAFLQRPLLSGKQPDCHEYVTSSGHGRPDRTSRWATFARPSAYPRETFNGEKVDADYWNRNFTDYSKAWLEDHEEDELESSSRYRAFRRKRQAWYKRAQYTILRNPFIPLFFRFTIFLFALLALGLGTSIWKETGRITYCIEQEPRDARCRRLVGDEKPDYYRDPSGLMAIIVDAIALLYTIYITYDEYFSKPLGLRPARAKVRLVLLDLFFVVFQSANLSLSFESLTVDEGACQSGPDPRTASKFDQVCHRAQALSAVLLVSLTAWLMTFSVSVLRYVSNQECGVKCY